MIAHIADGLLDDLRYYVSEKRLSQSFDSRLLITRVCVQVFCHE